MKNTLKITKNIILRKVKNTLQYSSEKEVKYFVLNKESIEDIIQVDKNLIPIHFVNLDNKYVLSEESRMSIRSEIISKREMKNFDVLLFIKMSEEKLQDIKKELEILFLAKGELLEKQNGVILSYQQIIINTEEKRLLEMQEIIQKNIKIKREELKNYLEEMTVENVIKNIEKQFEDSFQEEGK